MHRTEPVYGRACARKMKFSGFFHTWLFSKDVKKKKLSEKNINKNDLLDNTIQPF